MRRHLDLALVVARSLKLLQLCYTIYTILKKARRQAAGITNFNFAILSQIIFNYRYVNVHYDARFTRGTVVYSIYR